MFQIQITFFDDSHLYRKRFEMPLAPSSEDAVAVAEVEGHHNIWQRVMHTDGLIEIWVWMPAATKQERQAAEALAAELVTTGFEKADR